MTFEGCEQGPVSGCAPVSPAGLHTSLTDVRPSPGMSRHRRGSRGAIEGRPPGGHPPCRIGLLAEHKAYLHRSGRTARAGADGVVITVQNPAQAADVRGLMRRAGVSPLAATVSPGSALLRSNAGPPAARVAPAGPPAAAAALAASPVTGRRAVAMSAGHRGRRRL